MAIISSGAAAPRGGHTRHSVPGHSGARESEVGVLESGTSRLLDPAAAPGREDSLRPRRLAEYIGQSELKQVLAIAVEATRSRGEPPSS